MSTPVYANVPVGFKPTAAVTFINANGTAAKIIVDNQPAAVATSTAPQFYGGGTVIDLTASSSDSAARDVQLYEGEVTTTVGSNTGAVTTTTSSIPRSSGSYIADGWLVGDLAMTFAPFGTAPNAGVDGIPCIVTSVGALGLGLNGTPIAALGLATGTRILRVRPTIKASVPATAGTVNSVGSYGLLNNANDGTVIRTEIKLGANSILAAAMGSAVTSGAFAVSISAKVALY